MNLFFRKNQRLKSEKDINQLFLSGKSIFSHPIKLVFFVRSDKPEGFKVLFSVPKKHHKKAIQRNTIRRRMKEAFRINNILNTIKADGLHFAFVYVSHEIVGYKAIENAVIKLLADLKTVLEEENEKNK